MKNKGFSLIEVTVAIALIGIMAGIGVPKLRRQMALGRDTKAIATLGTLRTASELYFIENNEPLSEAPTSEESENITYGGTISLTFKNPDINKSTGSDGVYIWFKPSEGKEYNTKGNKWIEY